MEPHLQVQSLRVEFAGHVAVRGVDFAAGRGELVTLLGPSGCGKTTTLRAVAGFTRLAQGAITLGGAEIGKTPAHQRNIGMVFQSYALFPHLTVRENVAFGLRMRRVRPAERRERATATLDLVGLGGLADRYPTQLSGGQQQRVALARALVIEPSLLLLDEPLSNLDANLRTELRGEIRALQSRLGITTILVTHDQQEAIAISDRIVVMKDGEVVEIGSPKVLCEHPAKAFTAEFIGARTVVGGAVNAGVFTADGLTCRGAPAEATAIVLRAARLRFDESGPLSIEGVVRECAYLGDFFETVVSTPFGTLRAVTPSDLSPPANGSPCRLSAQDGGYSFLA